jgi:hypothetical protein
LSDATRVPGIRQRLATLSDFARVDAVDAACLLRELDRVTALLNSPEILNFAQAVQLEAAHQRERWGTEHDGGKTDADWFWLIGYLAGKALHNPAPEGVRPTHAYMFEKRLHRIVTVAAAACNWHAAVLGQTNMRPGIAPPNGQA